MPIYALIHDTMCSYGKGSSAEQQKQQPVCQGYSRCCASL